MAEIIFYLGATFITLMGFLITRVGLHGEHLGTFRLVSYVKTYEEKPRLHHRIITAGSGIVLVLLGISSLIYQLAVLRVR